MMQNIVFTKSIARGSDATGYKNQQNGEQGGRRTKNKTSSGLCCQSPSVANPRRGKLISSLRLKKQPNAAAQAFRAATNTLRNSDCWLGDFFKRKKAKAGGKYAIVATARKLASIYFKIVRYKQPFQPLDIDACREKMRKEKIEWLKRKLYQLEHRPAA